ncbi:CNNM domain-containing protein [Luminiphilus sp.]|nr:CNNM domain-containing protein [Luminiphilus sp.]
MAIGHSSYDCGIDRRVTLLLVYLTIAIGVSFLCSILEAVLLSITPAYLEHLLKIRPKSGAHVQKVKTRMDESLSGILILNTFAHTMGAAGVGAQALRVFGPEMEAAVAILLTLTILYFSEIIPKTIGAVYWRALAVPAAFAIAWLTRLTYPLVWVATRLTGLLGDKNKDAVTRDEILALASLGHRHGALISHETEYLENILLLRGVKTEAILTPRTVVHMLNVDTSVSAALSMEKTRQFSRIPTFKVSVDQIAGHVLRSDLYEAERLGQGSESIETLVRDVIHVSEQLPVHKLIDLFIKHRMHLFVVQDEFGQTAGVVTLEDALETLLGTEIIDESDTVADMQELAREKNRRWLDPRR